MNVIQNMVTQLQIAFDYVNKSKYEGKLPQPVIILSKGKRSSLGHFWRESWLPLKREKDMIIIDETDKDNIFHEINIIPERLARPVDEILETLIHEVAHLSNFVKGVKDVSGNQFHNKKFKTEAEFLGLKVAEKDKKYGFGFTSLDIEGQAIVDEIKKLTDFDSNAFNWKRIEGNKIKKEDDKASINIRTTDAVEERWVEMLDESGMKKAEFFEKLLNVYENNN
jgi:hypothetical protein